MKTIFLLVLIYFVSLQNVRGGNQHRSVLLSDVKTLTLHKGQRTEARRVSAIPQIRCVGGSARCSFEPDVVQCYNRGSDGVDIQWECTAQMPMKYRFGKLSVSCEGYSYADDPNILAGSCGLEYNLELTDQRNQQSTKSSSSSGIGSFLVKLIIIVGVFLLIRSYLSNNRSGGTGQSSTGPDHRPPGGGGGGWFSNFFPGGGGGFGSGWGSGNARPRQPPPPGFRDDFTYGYDGADCHANQPGHATGGGNGNFFTGAALGALGGYLFGARNRQTHTTYQAPNAGNTGWFTGTTATGSGRRASSSSSGSTYTSSGFGGTTRR